MKANKDMARPEKFTADEVAQALRDARGMPTIAAANLGCAFNTVKRYIDKYATVSQAAEESKAVLGDQIESTLLDKALGIRNADGTWQREPDVTCLIFVSKTHPSMRERGYGQQLALTGASGGALQVEFIYPDDDSDS